MNLNLFYFLHFWRYVNQSKFSLSNVFDLLKLFYKKAFRFILKQFAANFKLTNSFNIPCKLVFFFLFRYLSLIFKSKKMALLHTYLKITLKAMNFPFRLVSHVVRNFEWILTVQNSVHTNSKKCSKREWVRRHLFLKICLFFSKMCFFPYRLT